MMMMKGTWKLKIRTTNKTNQIKMKMKEILRRDHQDKLICVQMKIKPWMIWDRRSKIWKQSLRWVLDNLKINCCTSLEKR